MRKRAWGATLGIVLGTVVAFHSFVYACDHEATAKAPRAEATVPAVTVDVTVPMDHLQVRHVSLVCTQSMMCDSTRPTAVQTARRTAKVAITLGRALVTTVGAVVDSLVDAAVGATASLV